MVQKAFGEGKTLSDTMLSVVQYTVPAFVNRTCHKRFLCTVVYPLMRSTL